MVAGRIQINPGWCKGCEICVEFCPGRALGLVEQKARMQFPEKCIMCGLCELRCPDYAIWTEAIADDDGTGEVRKNGCKASRAAAGQ